MPRISGSVYDVGLNGSRGTLWISAGFRTGSLGVIAPRRVPYAIVDGQLSDNVVVEPGPAVIEIDVGVDARDSWPVVIPDADVSLRDLIAEAYEWDPVELSAFAQLRADAEAAAEAARLDRLQTGLDRTATGQDRTQTGLDRVATGEDRTATGEDRTQIGLDRTATGEDRTQTGLDREQTRLDRVATGQDRTQTGLDRSAAAGSATAAAGSATAAAGFAEDAELWATSFGLTATATTGAPGTQAAVTVTGAGPEYGLSLTVPRGDKGPKGDDGEVSQAALDAAVASLVDNAPEALNTLDELAGALGNDPNFATTVSTEIGLRAKTADVNTALAGKASASHSHTAAEVGAKPVSYVPAWSEVTGKPTTFPAATHSHTKADVGLANVDNTSDAAKPVSTAQQAAINVKTEVRLVASFPASPETGVLYVTGE